MEKALVDMWVRRVEFTVMMPVGNFWRHAHPRTAALLTQYKDFGEANRETYKGAQKYLDRELAGEDLACWRRLFDGRHLPALDGRLRGMDRPADRG